MLAKQWGPQCDPRGWWISEKLDGVRGYWDGAQFFSRAGNRIFAPDWFTEGLPAVPLDGELWAGRGNFEMASGIARSQASDAWKRMKFMVFDAPSHPGGFEERQKAVRELVKRAPYARAVKHYRCKGEGHMHHELSSVEDLGGEGLVLRSPGSQYEGRRVGEFLKVVRFHDAEAVITGYYRGKGKHAGVIGGFWVETLPDQKVRGGIRFKIGTGLSDAQRLDPPPIGTVITYRYRGVSGNGTPRFASFLRVRRP